MNIVVMTEIKEDNLKEIMKQRKKRHLMEWLELTLVVSKDI